MPKLSAKERNAKIVGVALAEVIPQSDISWFRQPHLLRLNLLLLVPLLSSSVSGYDGSLMNGLQALPQWNSDFGYPTGYILGLVNAIMPIAMFLALPILPWITDRFGRKVPIFIGSAGVIVASLIQLFSVNYGMFVFSRAILGFCGSFMIQPSALLIAELAYPTHRGKYTAAFFTMYYFGGIIASWITFACQNLHGSLAWKVPTIFQAALPLVQVCLIWFVPESPRWLVAKDRVQDASELLYRIHDPTPESQLVARELSEMVESIHMEKEASLTTWRSLFATPGNRKRVAVAICVGLFAQWNGVAVVSYYLSKVLTSVGITSTFDQTLINGMLQIFNFGAALTGAFLVDRLGRRLLFLWSTAGMLVSYIVWTACSAVNAETGSSAAGIMVVVCLFFYYFHYDIAYTPLLLAYPTEIFPYSLRAKGLALEFYFNSGGLVIGQFVNPIGMENIGWHYYIVFCVLLLIMLVIVWLLFPETKGHSLEEIAFIFDGPQAETSLAMDKRVEAETAEHKEHV
ncbi:hypothetical protein E8E14_004202 [Neopestalotiopsis sp. 37M]|nr:hypothetical protein E8E14_004202 [Neopestalotiopsis sp. 37M]